MIRLINCARCGRWVPRQVEVVGLTRRLYCEGCTAKMIPVTS